jgi:hypothetical protein
MPHLEFGFLRKTVSMMCLCVTIYGCAATPKPRTAADPCSEAEILRGKERVYRYSRAIRPTDAFAGRPITDPEQAADLYEIRQRLMCAGQLEAAAKVVQQAHQPTPKSQPTHMEITGPTGQTMHCSRSGNSWTCNY